MRIIMKKESKKSAADITGNWLYFAGETVDVRQICRVLEAEYEVEIWEDAGVLEIVLGEKSSFDIEAAQIHPKDEITRRFAEENGCSKVFLVTFPPEDYEKAEGIMRKILGACCGIFCGDTEDFMPVLRGKE
jgi:hypothetical protein